MASYQPLRSALYMPGTNARALEKAAGLEVDCVIMDLEDGVAPDVKADAHASCVSMRSGPPGLKTMRAWPSPPHRTGSWCRK